MQGKAGGLALHWLSGFSFLTSATRGTATLEHNVTMLRPDAQPNVICTDTKSSNTDHCPQPIALDMLMKIS